MIALFFEVTPRPGQDDRYLEIAAGLKPALETNGGIVFLDRFRSLSRPRTLLSHQIWQDEASLARWRANGRHYGAQTAGRTAVFEDYRLRIGVVVAARREPGHATETAPGIAYNDPAAKPERFVVVVRSTGIAFASGDGKSSSDEGSSGETWRSVYNDASFAWVAAVPDRAAGLAIIHRASADPCVSAAQLCLVSRDYGMFDRHEAPQYFPEAGARQSSGT